MVGVTSIEAAHPDGLPVAGKTLRRMEAKITGA
jgi:hypothetical protein